MQALATFSGVSGIGSGITFLTGRPRGFLDSVVMALASYECYVVPGGA